MGSDIFEKCYNFNVANDLKIKGFYPYFHKIESVQGPEVIVDGEKK